MRILPKKLYPWSAGLSTVKWIYDNSFPEHERLPFWELVALSQRRCGELWGFFDTAADITWVSDEVRPSPYLKPDHLVPVGFAQLLFTDEMLYLFYLATAPGIRSRGYGTTIINWLKEKAAGQQIVLDMETVLPGFDNYEQRLARQRFYFRNGFHDTGYRVIDELHAYDVLSSDDRFRPEQLERLIKVASFGTDHDMVIPVEVLPEKYKRP